MRMHIDGKRSPRKEYNKCRALPCAHFEPLVVGLHGSEFGLEHVDDLVHFRLRIAFIAFVGNLLLLLQLLLRLRNGGEFPIRSQTNSDGLQIHRTSTWNEEQIMHGATRLVVDL